MSGYGAVIAAAFFGFLLLAFILLAPVYRFLKREEQLSDEWTPEAVAARRYKTRSENGKADQDEDEADQDRLEP